MFNSTVRDAREEYINRNMLLEYYKFLKKHNIYLSKELQYKISNYIL